MTFLFQERTKVGVKLKLWLPPPDPSPETNTFASEKLINSFWGRKVIFRGKLAVSFREGTSTKHFGYEMGLAAFYFPASIAMDWQVFVSFLKVLPLELQWLTRWWFQTFVILITWGRFPCWPIWNGLKPPTSRVYIIGDYTTQLCGDFNKPL